jgi:hypothetical protein
MVALQPVPDGTRRRPGMASPTGGTSAGSRMPPHNFDAEEFVLGAMLLSRDAIAVVVEQVSAEDFYPSPRMRISTQPSPRCTQGANPPTPSRFPRSFDGSECSTRPGERQTGELEDAVSTLRALVYAIETTLPKVHIRTPASPSQPTRRR